MNQRTLSIVSFLFSVAFFWLMTQSLAVAVGFLLLLFIHEMGHYLACQYKGIPATLPVFTPFGAMIMLDPRDVKSARDEAFMAIAGPLAGGIASLIVLALSAVLGSRELYTIGYWSVLLNLFNLVPLAPLDGGRISMAVERRLWIVGFPLLVFVFWKFGLNFFNLVIAYLIFSQAWQDKKFRSAMAEQNPEYFNVGTATKVGYGLAYVGLAALLGWVFFAPSQFIGLLVGLGL